MSKIIGNNLPDMPWQEPDHRPLRAETFQQYLQQRSRTVRGRIRRCIPLRQPFHQHGHLRWKK